MKQQRTIHLTPPHISQAHIKEKVTCIRAHRERIFQVSIQLLDNKLVCHNYGQGGAGWTFLFGCVNESVRQFEQQLQQNPTLKNKPITIIGAGCYGLLTAIILARKGYVVRIVAKADMSIPSYKAAGFFFPRPRKTSTPQELAIFLSLGMESYRTYLEIINGHHAFIKHGPKLLPGYFALDIDPGFGPYIQQGLVSDPERVTIDFGNNKRYDVMEYKTIFINSSVIMQELERAIADLGIIIARADIDSLDDIPEEIIFNCAGLGAKQLASDQRMIPVQGHLITLKDQPDMAQLQYMINVKIPMLSAKGFIRDELVYYAPKESGILGVTFMRGEESLTANQHEFDRLLERAQSFFGVAE